jgi:rifampin ADP-ribosylating transferase
MHAFSRLMPELDAGLQALAFDQRGHRDAEKPASGYLLTDDAEDVTAFLDAVGIPSAVLLGSSSGGYVAQQVALGHPSRVRGMVLVGAPRMAERSRQPPRSPDQRPLRAAFALIASWTYCASPGAIFS